MTRQGFKMNCKFCGAPGHNKKGFQWRKFAEEFIQDEGEQRPQPQVPNEMTQGDDIPVQEMDTQPQHVEETTAATQPKLTARKRTSARNKGITISELSRASPRKATIANSTKLQLRKATSRPFSKAKKPSGGG
ncbi:hypothetical protein Salat_0211500 [Sesamum alatum]|uniref:Uncharacterized protein n=1 Tax=Sesamum alatum TaxID=300844 RepID=A0AAE2CYI7_9LAMI|nr:hypothetical protein Salat_0211500 [Sesamum alatum]